MAVAERAGDPLLVAGTAQARWVLAATVLGSGIASLDATVVGVALPTIGRDLRTGVASLQWVVTAYTLTLAAFLLLGGALGDRLGRRRIFSVGVVWFAVASAACAAAPTSASLIAARAVEGVGAALLTPGSLAILQASFRSEDRAQAIGAWSGLGGLANAAGPLVGGELIALSSWRWVFLINVPIAAITLALAARHVPESRDVSVTGRLDLGGAALAVCGLGGLVYGLIEGPTRGWTDPAVVIMLAVAGVAGGAFVVLERRIESPMLPPAIFASRQFSAANATTFAVYAGLGGALFLLPTELQVTGRYSPVASGLALLPVTAIMLFGSAPSGRLSARIGPRLQMGAGPLIVAGGLALLSRAAGDTSYATGVLPGVLVFGVGLACTVAPLTATAMGAAPPGHSGIASAVNNDVARAGSLIAVAALPPLAGITGATYLNARALSAGFRTAVLAAAGVCAAGGIVAALTIRNPGQPSGEPCPPHCATDGPPLRAEA